MQEKIIQTKICKQCNSNFDITDKDLEFYDKISPVFSGKKIIIPSPTLCPDCRQQRRLSFRNERKLYKRKCDLTGKEIISIYSPDKNYKVYNQEDWWSDKWDALDYGIEFNFNKTFFEQFNNLINKVPKISITNHNSENSEYTNQSENNKNCYMMTSTNLQENSMYGHWCQRGKNNIDNLLIEECELCYECVNIKNGFESYFCTNSNNIYNCYYCDDCSNISYSIGSVGKKHGKYIILNECFDEKYYLYFLKKLKTDKSFYSDFLKKYKILKDNFIKKYFNGINNINFIGDYVQNCNNSFYSFNNRDCKDIKFCFDSWQEKFCYDLTETLDDEKSYEVQGSAYGNGLLFVSQTWHNSKVLYSQLVFYSNNCFGCVGLKNKEYCILNKQYTKEEYEELVPKIIKHIQKTGEWGEFFPSSISPFGYNETTAQEYYPLSKKESQDYLFNWSNYETPFPKVSKIIPADKLPDNISDIPDDILNWAIECEITKKPFRIIKQELEFYRKHNLPIPKRHPDQRHLDRMALRNPRKLFDRKCDKCSVDMKTTYSPDREELVYCEECYNKEIY